MAGQTQPKAFGFTVVELLIAIAVIGILASIALVVYPGYQQRARDTQRKSDVQQVAAALSAYVLQKNDYVGKESGCGRDGKGNGWLAAGSGDVFGYQNSIVECLADADVLKTGEFVDPSGCVGVTEGECSPPVKAYMKATCERGGESVTYVLAYLESEPQKANEIDELCDSGSVAGFDAASQKWGTEYGMNYYVTVR